MLTALTAPDPFLLALVEVDGTAANPAPPPEPRLLRFRTCPLMNAAGRGHPAGTRGEDFPLSSPYTARRR